jgi:hypothetical protein
VSEATRSRNPGGALGITLRRVVSGDRLAQFRWAARLMARGAALLISADWIPGTHTKEFESSSTLIL